MRTAPNKSIIQRDSPRKNLVVFEILEKITKADIEWMSTISDDAMTEHTKIDMMIIMSHFDGEEWGALFDSHAMSVMTRSIAHIQRYVVVGAPTFADAMVNLSGLVSPVETKTFALENVQAAWDWLERDTAPSAPA